PFMPFITEEIWSILNHNDNNMALMISSWPVSDHSLHNRELEDDFTNLIGLIRGIRNIRAEMNLASNKEINVTIVSRNKNSFLKQFASHISKLTNAPILEFHDKLSIKPKDAVSKIVSDIEIFVPLAGLIDINKETERINKEINKNNDEIQRLLKKLSNQEFVKKAPGPVIDVEKAKLKSCEDKKILLDKQLDNLSS
ncbi:MAG: class I tRNA ligase family protein, partial [bacterium]